MDDQTSRLSGTDRRTLLIASALALLEEQGVDAVTMESVAARAGVSRPLVYKHFANRHDLLSTVYRDEATKVDREMSAAVGSATDLESALRALVRAMYASLATHRPTFVNLARAGARDGELRREQRSRDERTVRFFSRLARQQFDLDERTATSAMAMVLGGIEAVRLQAVRNPSAARRRQLEDRFVALALGGLERVAGARDPEPT